MFQLANTVEPHKVKTLESKILDIQNRILKKSKTRMKHNNMHNFIITIVSNKIIMNRMWYIKLLSSVFFFNWL